MRLPVHLQREIARLHFYDQRQSHRGIAASLGLSHSTVRNMRVLLVASERSWLGKVCINRPAICLAPT
jgi:hypothetical protein